MTIPHEVPREIPGLTLLDGTFYPHSFDEIDLDRLRTFILFHQRTITLTEYARGDHDLGAISIRHDVDHSASHALEFARWEHRWGIRSTYFLLPTAQYWDIEARESAQELQRLGHEVGVHNDAHTAAGTPEGALKLLREWVAEMRSWGIFVTGCADHGGGEPQNVMLWREPINYTPADAGLEYEAYLLHGGTNYISDNQGEWRAPLERRPDRPSHILCHCEHWILPE